MTNDSGRKRRDPSEVVSAYVIGSGVIDFELIFPSPDPDWTQSYGFLRGDELFLRLMDDDNQTTVVMHLTISEDSTTIFVGEVMGYHLGQTHTHKIDSTLLQQDSALRAMRDSEVPYFRDDVADWGALHTRLDCVHVLKAMLTLVYPGWKVQFSPVLPSSPSSSLSTLSTADNTELEERFERLSENKAKRKLSKVVA